MVCIHPPLEAGAYVPYPINMKVHLAKIWAPPPPLRGKGLNAREKEYDAPLM